MKISAKIVIFLLLLILGSSVDAKEVKSPEYLKYVDEIVNDFVKDMEEKHELHCYGSGGSMPHDVEEISVLFTSYRKSPIEEARKVEVSAIKELLHRINTHEKIRPFLREYPFNADRIDVSIAFQTTSYDYPLDGTVAFVYLAKNKIFYKAAEMRTKEPIRINYAYKKPEGAEEFIEREPRAELMDLMDEPYEDALKILGLAPQPKKE